MSPRNWRFLAGFLLLPATVAGGEFADRVRPVLESRCLMCHGESLASAGVRLDELSDDIRGNRRASEVWGDVLNVVNRGEMPPKGAPALTDAERSTVVDWVTRELRLAAEQRRSTSGEIALRRLNRVEYQNTMRELLGLDLDYVKNLPPDETSRDGFKNNGSALRMSALQLEYYLESARRGLRHAIVEGPAPEVARARGEESAVDKVKNIHWSSRLGRTGVFTLRSLEFPDEGEFVIRVRARAELPLQNSPFPRMEIKLGYRADTQTPSRVVGTVDVSNAEARTFEFRGRMEEYPRQSRSQSKYPGLLVWARNVYSDGEKTPEPREVIREVDGKKTKDFEWDEDPKFPKVIVESVEFEAPVSAAWPPRHHRHLLPTTPANRDEEAAAAREALEGFLPRAFRRPVEKDSVDTLLRYFREVRPTLETYEQAMRETLAMALVSPDFLFLLETGGAVDDFELASRLSYFLWSSMPDDRLTELASSGRLRKPETLSAEVERMLADERSFSFIEQFSDQWLDLPGVDRVAVNPNYYPDFDPSLKAEMRREAQHFFAEVLQNDLSALTLLRADFAMLNQPLAAHYDLPGPRGGAFERVALKPGQRPGGLPAQGAFFLSNSTGEDSHPIERGVWVRTVLLDDPPPPPPPSVPNLDNAGDSGLLPLKQQLELHLDNAACASCHRSIDPWGLALEEYDAVGLLRGEIRRRVGDREERHPVDAAATMPDGTKVNGLRELQDYLVAERERDFARALTVKLTTYALGRSLGFRDHELIEELTDGFAESGHSLKKLITMIVENEAFTGGA